MVDLSYLQQPQIDLTGAVGNLLQAQQLGQQRAVLQQRIAEKKQEDDETAAFQQEAAQVAANPTPEGYQQLLLKYPRQHEGLKAAWDNYSEGQKTRNTEAASQVYSALAAGRTDLAKQLLKTRRDALQKAGESTEVTDSMLEMIDSGDPKQVQQARGIAGMILATATGPDKIASTLQALGDPSGEQKGQVVGRAIGHYENGQFQVDYRDPDAPEYREIDTVDASGNPVKQLVRIDPGAGGASPAQPTSAGGGFDSAVEHVLSNEGGYNPSDMNGKPVNFGINQGANPDVNVKGLTRDQAKQLYYERYWKPSGAEKLPANLQAPYFDVYIRNPGFAKATLAKSKGDPQKFMELASTYFQDLAAKNPRAAPYAKSWANRDAKSLAIATGGGGQANGEVSTVASFSGSKKPGYQVLSREEVSTIPGLDPNTVYQRSPDGQITAVGGQNKSQLKAWPAPALAARATNAASLTNIDKALTLFDPNNKSKESVKAKKAVGYGTGAFGDQFTQWNDPEGTSARALVGQIGGLIIKDVSGAAVSVSEDERLKKWVPLVTDKPSVIRDKLQNLRSEVAQRNAAMDDTYSEDQGYRPFKAAQAPVRVRSIQELKSLPKGTPVTLPDGRSGTVK